MEPKVPWFNKYKNSSLLIVLTPLLFPNSPEKFISLIWVLVLDNGAKFAEGSIIAGFGAVTGAGFGSGFGTGHGAGAGLGGSFVSIF